MSLRALLFPPSWRWRFPLHHAKIPSTNDSRLWLAGPPIEYQLRHRLHPPRRVFREFLPFNLTAAFPGTTSHIDFRRRSALYPPWQLRHRLIAIPPDPMVGLQLGTPDAERDGTNPSSRRSTPARRVKSQAKLKLTSKTSARPRQTNKNKSPSKKSTDDAPPPPSSIQSTLRRDAPAWHPLPAVNETTTTATAAPALPHTTPPLARTNAPTKPLPPPHPQLDGDQEPGGDDAGVAIKIRFERPKATTRRQRQALR